MLKDELAVDDVEDEGDDRMFSQCSETRSRVVSTSPLDEVAV